MSDCCTIPGKPKTFWQKYDFLFWGSFTVVGIFYLQILFFPQWNTEFSESIFELMNKMWWGLALGITFVGIIDKIPRNFVTSILGKGGTFSGILRATGAGVLLDLCSHGILMVGMKLYERGASLGQVMAFLIASPWNSFSLTLILWALVGFKLMITFLLLSMIIAVISGIIFEKLVSKKILPENPNKTEISRDFKFWKEAKKKFQNRQKKDFWKIISEIIKSGFVGSKMVLRWTLFGVVLASVIRVLFSPENFEKLFGPTLAGLGLTILVATIIEVCSEGSTPIAADIVTIGKAPGNGFAFLMTGVSTDYTEMMVLKDTTKSWKIALFLPLVTLPQVILLSWILNNYI
jgi:uncharacterized membrane protein YraQ (UPF0718 family)